MTKIELSKGLYAIVDAEDFEAMSKYSWIVHTHGYACSRPRKDEYGSQRRPTYLLHRLIMGPPPGMEIDHINGNKLDCRKSNLRVCTRRQNCMNTGKQSNNTSGYKGVHFRKDRNYFTVQIMVGGKTHRRGGFRKVLDAAVEYDRLARKLHGEFAWLNFPEADHL